MRRITLLFLAALRLCEGRTNGFSIHEDLLAFPQYEVVFSETFISEKEAEALLKNNPPHPTYSADFSQPTIGDAKDASETEHGATSESSPEPGRTYEVINMPPYRYLCTIPVVQPPAPENQTANELAKAEEARELSRAAENGWGLLSELQDSCIYFTSGWWSYSFCNNREIVQFHAMAATVNGQPPRRDPQTADYVLGLIPTLPSTTDQKARQESGQKPLPAELQVKGDKRYLVQRLEGGTVCDLTGRERTIEVQYHCVPGIKSARIGWIKEVITCVYIMVVNTPRLCNDVAFLPPAEIKANPITCQLIAEDNYATPPLLEQALTRQKGVAGEAQHGNAEEPRQDVEATLKSAPTIGGIVVGARSILSGADEAGKPPTKLGAPRNIFAGQKNTDGKVKEVLAQGASKEDGGKITALTPEELEKMDLQPEMIKEMRERIEELAGELGWKLEIVELPGAEFRELHGYIDEEEVATTDGAAPGEAGTAGQGKKGKKAVKGQDKGQGKANGKDQEKGEDDGSEEKFFKEEL